MNVTLPVPAVGRPFLRGLVQVREQQLNVRNSVHRTMRLPIQDELLGLPVPGVEVEAGGQIVRWCFVMQVMMTKKHDTLVSKPLRNITLKATTGELASNVLSMEATRPCPLNMPLGQRRRGLPLPANVIGFAMMAIQKIAMVKIVCLKCLRLQV